MPSSYDGASMRAPRPTLSTGARSTTLRFATILVTAALAVSGLLGVSPHASAAAGHPSSRSSGTQAHRMSAAQRFNTKADRVLRVTRRHRGDWYQYGAAGPSRFDCSGLVMYVYQHALGKSLPHNAQAQYQRSRHITRAHLRRGDLVFQMSGGYAFHVGIYAGRGYMWDAPHSGARVHKHKMYNAHWRFGRLIPWS
jgi:cell wall-associated NlpC family hydrolase